VTAPAEPTLPIGSSDFSAEKRELGRPGLPLAAPASAVSMVVAAFVDDQSVVAASASAVGDQWLWSDLTRVAQRQIDLLSASSS
jgi:hypothetical protein